MDKLLDILMDVLIDSVKLIPFLFIAFLIIELIEHRFTKKTVNAISKSGKFGPLIGSVAGAFPQCGFSVLATNLYVTRIVSIGTLVAIYLSTSDEILPIMISEHVAIPEILKIVGLKVLIGMIVGFIIDFIFRKKEKKSFDICKEEKCHCGENIWLSSLIHTLKTLVFIALISFAIDCMFEYGGEDIINKVLKGSPVFAPFVSSLVGLIPNCGASVAITELYLSNAITFGTAMAGLLTGSGLALLVLFKSNKDLKENLVILLSIYLIGVLCGVVINLIGLFV